VQAEKLGQDGEGELVHTKAREPNQTETDRILRSRQRSDAASQSCPLSHLLRPAPLLEYTPRRAWEVKRLTTRESHLGPSPAVDMDARIGESGKAQY
jgi:hypothetical protein